MDESRVDLEIKLIESSLLPAEHLSAGIEWPRVLDIASSDSRLNLRVTVAGTYPQPGSVSIDVRGPDVGRDEAEGWRQWAADKLKEWDTEGFPLFQILTDHFLPLLAPERLEGPQGLEGSEGAAKVCPTEAVSTTTGPHHALLTSHHLLAPSKRKDLHSLSSQLSLVGFAKTGHPGIMYAIGDKQALDEWVREVKSWQWLALRVRIAPEPCDPTGLQEGGRGKDSGARGGKGRGEWSELAKVGEAVEWMRSRGRGSLLTELGIGVGPDK